MIGSFSARSVRIGDLLAGHARLSVPGFQRPYSWTTAEAGRLVEELVFAVGELLPQAQRAAVFFLGTMVLIQPDADDPRAPSVNIIVDGQQRIVTLTMLFAILRDLSRREGSAALADRLSHLVSLSEAGSSDYRITLRERDAQFMMDWIQQPDSTLEPVDPEEFEGPQRALIANRNFLLEEIGGLEPGLRQQLAEFLIHNCQVVVITTGDIDQAFRIFAVVNQPGKPLARNDLLKAEIVGDLPDAERESYIRHWENAEAVCGADFEQFFSHLRTAFGSSRAPIINDIRRLVSEVGGARPFLDQVLLPCARVFGALHGRVAGAGLFNSRALRSVRNLERLTHTDWIPPVLLWAMAREREPDAIADFLAALDRYAHGHMLLGIGRDKRVTRYRAIIEALLAGGQIDPGRLLALTGEEQRNIVFNASNDLYSRSSMGCKLLLLRLNDAAGGGTLSSNVELTIEHILPQRLGRNSPWRQLFSDAQLARYSGSLGNLVLVTPQTNKAARNHDFVRKLEVYRQDTFLRSLPINAGVLTADQFGPAEIEQRETGMLAVLGSLWEPGRRPSGAR